MLSPGNRLIRLATGVGSQITGGGDYRTERWRNRLWWNGSDNHGGSASEGLQHLRHGNKNNLIIIIRPHVLIQTVEDEKDFIFSP